MKKLFKTLAAGPGPGPGHFYLMSEALLLMLRWRAGDKYGVERGGAGVANKEGVLADFSAN